MVQRVMSACPRTRESAEALVRSNLGYYAGYYDAETRMRVRRLFGAAHPYFGDKVPMDSEAFALGLELGRKARESEP